VIRLRKHQDISSFLSLLSYILLGLVKRYEVPVIWTVWIIFLSLNLIYAWWVLYITVKEKKNIPKYKGSLAGSIITAVGATGILVLVYFLASE
jgi:phosphatidylglycerophosphate synthase